MVCSFVEGLTSSQIMPEDSGRWKLPFQYIQREIKEADEVNLLDEEDMHVFGLRPMMDPLILVCCNSCKRPVRVSQYATHAEICKSLSSLVDSTTETNVVSGQKKPPKKEKKSQNSISKQVASVGKPERRAISNTATSNTHVDEQTLKKTSIPIHVKGNAFRNETQAKNAKNFDNVTSHPTPRKHNDQHLQTNGRLNFPAPLATKIFYSQRTQRLRSAISHMYYRSSSSSTQHDNGLSDMQVSGYCHENNIDDPHEKLGKHIPCMLEDTDAAKSPEVSSNESRKLLPLNVSDQFHVNNTLGHQKTHVGSLASSSLRNPYPFDEN